MAIKSNKVSDLLTISSYERHCLRNVQAKLFLVFLLERSADYVVYRVRVLVSGDQFYFVQSGVTGISFGLEKKEKRKRRERD